MKVNNFVWRETNFGELVDFFDHRRIPVSSRERATRKGPYPYYGASGVVDHVDSYIFEGSYLLVSEDGENLNSRKTPIAFRAEGKFWVNNHAHIVRGRTNVADDRFLEYLLAVTDISGMVTGAAQPKLSQSNLRLLKVTVPDIRGQRAIARTLSAYDDLIENNTRRIKIMEQMAQMLYREWFVNFRFPGHEKVKMVDSELGAIPLGWTVKSLKDVSVLIGRGISPTYDDAADGLVINQKCIRDGKLSLAPARRQSKKVPEEKMVQEGDVLINSTGVGTLGRVAQVLEPIANCTVDSHVSIVRPKENAGFFGRALLELEDHFAAQGIGSTGQTELSRERIALTPMVIPSAHLQEQFCQIIAPMNGMLVCGLGRNDILRKTRDLLLPKLVPGEISVEQIESEVPAQTV